MSGLNTLYADNVKYGQRLITEIRSRQTLVRFIRVAIRVALRLNIPHQVCTDEGLVAIVPNSR
jgi:hypothetical protein